MDLDIPYAEHILSRAYSTHLNFRKVGTEGDYLGEIKFTFESEGLAYAALYYLHYRVKKEKIQITIEITSENVLLMTFDISGHGKIKTSTKSFNHIDASIYFNTGDIPYDTTKTFVSFWFPKNMTETQPLHIFDDKIEGGKAVCLMCYLHRYGSDGFRLLPEEPLSF